MSAGREQKEQMKEEAAHAGGHKAEMQKIDVQQVQRNHEMPLAKPMKKSKIHTIASAIHQYASREVMARMRTKMMSQPAKRFCRIGN